MAKKKAGATKQLTPALMSKMDAVRAALKEGVKKPAEGVVFIKDNFGINIAPQMFSAYKIHARKKSGRGRKATANGSTNHNRNLDGSLELVIGVKQLIDKHGSDKVVEMAKVLA
jgi:hypothetical protein